MKTEAEKYLKEKGVNFDYIKGIDLFINMTIPEVMQDFAKQDNAELNEKYRKALVLVTKLDEAKKQEAIEFLKWEFKQLGGDFYESEEIAKEEAIREYNKHKQDES